MSYGNNSLNLKTISSAWIILLILSGCVSTKQAIKDTRTTSVYMHLSFSQDMDRVSQGYRDALQNMNFDITHEEDGLIEAAETRGETGARVEVTFSESDTLKTDVFVTSEYYSATGNFAHYPYQLSGRAATFIDPEYLNFPYIHPQLIFPNHKKKCSAEPFEMNNRVELPVMKESRESFQQRLTYSTKAIEAGTEGYVYVETVIDENGEVTCAMIGAGLPNGLNENALAAVLRTEFEPGRYQGEPMTMKLTLPVIFRFRE